ncbi:MAG: Ig-like domain-containing protein [Nanobdellota archaeon]
MMSTSEKQGLRYMKRRYVSLLLLLTILVLTLPAASATSITEVPHDGFLTGSGSMVSEYYDTWYYDEQYYGVQTSRSPAMGNMSLSYNLSHITSNSANIISELNGTLVYCHTRNPRDGCTGIAPYSTSDTMNIYLQKGEGRSMEWDDVGNIPFTDRGNENTVMWETPSGVAITDYIDTNGILTVRYEYIFDTDPSTFLNDYSPIEVEYFTDREDPQSVLITPTDQSFVTSPEVNLTCNASDDAQLSNVALYHDASGTFHANETRIISGTKHQSIFTLSTLSEGIFHWNCFVTDMIGKYSFAPSNYTFTIDRTLPSLAVVSPQESSQSLLESVDLEVTTSDANGIKNVTATIKRPNGMIEKIQLSHDTRDTYIATYSATGDVGQYNVTFNSTDEAGNSRLNQTNFTIVDDVAPEVTINSPLDESMHPNGTSILIEINATDLPVGTVDTVHVTIRNSTGNVFFDQDLNESATPHIYNTTFNNTTIVDEYLLTVTANDTYGNINNTVNSTFTIAEANSSIVSLDSPETNYYTNEAIVDLTCSAQDAQGVTNLSLYHNATGLFRKEQSVPESGSPVSETFTVNFGDPGVYVWNCNATNQLGLSSFSPYNRTLTIDTIRPDIGNLSFSPGDDINTTDEINFSVNAVDETMLDSVIAEITLLDANASTTTITLSDDDSDDKFEASFADTTLDGDYMLTITATDMAGNTNLTTKIFTVHDVQAPQVELISPLENVTHTYNTTLVLEASVTDNVDVDNVFANITLSNQSTRIIELFDSNGDDLFNTSFDEMVLLGNYSIQLFVNDTSNNTNQTDPVIITVIDDVKPEITIYQPENNYTTAQNTTVINFTANDNYASNISCQLFFNATLEESNATVRVGDSTQLEITTYFQGTNNWFLTCTDHYNNTQVTSLQNITKDNKAPKIFPLHFVPEDDDVIDPNKTLNLSVKVTDSFTSPDEVIIRYKHESSANFTYNITTIYDDVSQTYNGSFTPLLNGTYQFKVYANDTVGNHNTSEIRNVTIDYDDTWTAMMTISEPQFTNTSTEYYYGNLIINNTGDYARNFTATPNNASLEIYGVTFPLELAAYESIAIPVNITTPADNGTFNHKILINTSPEGTPFKRNLTLDFFVGEGPLLDITSLKIHRFSSNEIESFSEGDELSTEKGSSYAIRYNLTNRGSELASNVTAKYTVPDPISSSSYSTYINNLTVDESAKSTFTLTPSDSGTYKITINTSGLNLDNESLEDQGRALTTYFFMKVYNPNTGTTEPTSPAGSGDTTTPAPLPEPSSGSSPPPSLSPATNSTEEEFLSTEKTINVLRGDNITFPLAIKNIFENAVLTNIEIEVDSEFEQYITSEPDMIYDIPQGESEEFLIRFTAPEYLTQDTVSMTFTIYGDGIIETDDNGTATTKKLIEERTITLRIRELTQDEGKIIKNETEQIVEELETNNITSRKASSIVSSIEAAIAEEEYEVAKKLQNDLEDLIAQAIDAKKKLAELERKVEQADKKGLHIYETKKVLSLAQSAFEREDYELALKRAKEAELIEMFEVKGAFNILNFIQRFWWALLLGVGLLSVLGVIAYNNILILYINKRLRSLSREKKLIKKNMRELQSKSFKEQEISMMSYHQQMFQFEKRLAEIKRLQTRLKMRKLGLINPFEELERLKQELERTQHDIKQSQKNYFITKKITKNRYEDTINELKTLQVEIEETITLITTKLVRKGHLAVDLLDKDARNLSKKSRGKVLIDTFAYHLLNILSSLRIDKLFKKGMSRRK